MNYAHLIDPLSLLISMQDGLISNVLCVALIEEFAHDHVWQMALGLTPGHLNSLLTMKELEIILV